MTIPGWARLSGYMAWGIIMSACAENSVRPSRVAGMFYPASPDKLRAMVMEHLRDVPEAMVPDGAVAVVAPHAGYLYSARIAAPAYQAMAKADFDTLVIIGHDFGRHAQGLAGVLCDQSHFATPLGQVSVDVELVRALCRADSRLVVHNEAHAREHTIEVHLPFVQVVKPNCRIVPVFSGEVSREHSQVLVDALQKCAGQRRIFILASTDLSHYPTAARARAFDEYTASLLRNFDASALCAWQQGGMWQEEGLETPICAAGGVATALLWASAHQAKEAVILRRGNSGDVPGGDPERVVGYLSMALCRPAAAPAPSEFPAAAADYLLKLARARIAARLAPAGTMPALPEAPAEPALQSAVGAFVTLHKQGRLRGCIGRIISPEPLAVTVAQMAEAAAFEDQRFAPVSADELPELHIEISVLSPLRRIDSWPAIEPGRHGVVVRRGRRSGLFLPQVWEQLPELESFMSCLCAEKAGLPATAWKEPDTELQVFTVTAFEEK